MSLTASLWRAPDAARQQLRTIGEKRPATIGAFETRQSACGFDTANACIWTRGPLGYRPILREARSCKRDRC